MRPVKGLVAGVIGIAVLALLIPRGDGEDPPRRERTASARAATVKTTGNLAKSRANGTPVFSVSNVSPGTIVEGTATIANSGGASGYFSLSQANLTDVPGPRGGALSDRLRMEIVDVTRPNRAVEVYDGPYAAMDVRPLGFIRAGSTRRYAFTATVSRDDGEAVTGSATSAQYVWSALEGVPAPTEPDEPPPVDRRPPRLTVRIPRVQRLITTPYLAAGVRCGEDCRLSVTGGPDRRLRAGRPAAVRIRIAPRRLRAFRRALLDGRRAKLRVTFTALDAERNRSIVKRTVRLKPRRR